MAITPRTILTSAAPATVAVISLYVFTALGTMAYKSSRDIENGRRLHDASRTVSTVYISSNGQNCSHVTNAFGADKRVWNERAWITYAACFHYQQDSPRAISAASQGLKYYPRSETLYNIVGQHQIMLEQHEEAIETLSTGMRNVSGFESGTMPNNLAWASLWSSRTVPLEDARTLYQQALALSPDSCEIVHTALWVEYASARNTTGVERVHALNRFQSLRQTYEPCMSRVHDADRITLAEIIGAATIIEDVDQQQFGTSRPHAASIHATKLLVRNHRNTSFDDICSEAMPLAETHLKCVAHLQENVETLHHNRVIYRNGTRHSANPHKARSTHCGGISR